MDKKIAPGLLYIVEVEIMYGVVANNEVNVQIDGLCAGQYFRFYPSFA